MALHDLVVAVSRDPLGDDSGILRNGCYRMHPSRPNWRENEHSYE